MRIFLEKTKDDLHSIQVEQEIASADQSADDSGAEKHVICIVWAPFKWYAFYGSKRGQDRHDGEF